MLRLVFPLRAAVLLALLVVTLGFAATADARYSYPSSEKKAFMKSCRASATAVANGRLTKSQVERYCTTALSCLQDRLSFSRLEKLSTKLSSGAKNPDAKVMTACIKVAAAKVAGSK
ncbi:MAG TPA: hypothetical protein VFB41_09465 [Solirubrobacteraceae bacterium]|nr:hypothetical protein [Solirubrobacteraceae bacterium]